MNSNNNQEIKKHENFISSFFLSLMLCEEKVEPSVFYLPSMQLKWNDNMFRCFNLSYLEKYSILYNESKTILTAVTKNIILSLLIHLYHLFSTITNILSFVTITPSFIRACNVKTREQLLFSSRNCTVKASFFYDSLFF